MMNARQVTEDISAALAALIAATPATRRHALIQDMAEALRAYPHPIVPVVCTCGHPMRSAPEVDIDGDLVYTEPMIHEVDYAVGLQQVAHVADYDSDGTTFHWSASTERWDQHTVAYACPVCHRMYVIPPTEKIEYC